MTRWKEYDRPIPRPRPRVCCVRCGGNSIHEDAAPRLRCRDCGEWFALGDPRTPEREAAIRGERQWAGWTAAMGERVRARLLPYLKEEKQG